MTHVSSDIISEVVLICQNFKFLYWNEYEIVAEAYWLLASSGIQCKML